MLSFLMSTFDSYIVTITTVETTRVLSAPFSAKIIPLMRNGTVLLQYIFLCTNIYHTHPQRICNTVKTD
jgi:hypothetical protein